MFIIHMGSNIPTQIIPNRHFIKLEVKPQQASSKAVLMGSVSVSSNTFVEAWASRMDRLDKSKLIHMFLPLSWKIASSNICGASKIVEIQYQNFNRTLSQEVKARSEEKKYFQQSKIWYACLALFTSAVQCIEEGDRITDFSLSNIFTNDEGNLKILTPYSLPQTFDPYCDPGIQDVYFSPQELKAKQLRYMHNTTQPAKSMAFAIGMVLLSICLLKPIYFIYDYNKNKINQQMLQSSLDQLTKLESIEGENIKSIYSDDLKNLIYKLLQIEPTNRPSAIEVYKQIADMQGQIIIPKPVKIESSLISSTSPKKKSLGRGQAITLRPSKLKNNSNLSPIAVTEPRVEKIQEQPFQPLLTQSKYVFSSPNPVFGSGLDLLRKIDQRLQKSREQFPS